MTDRELLELAAKAAGIEFAQYEERPWGIFGDIPGSGRKFWNPLVSDGDALRLAVKLGLSVVRQSNVVGVCQYGGMQGYLGGWSQFQVDRSDDEVTRRAIVRAAAEIGKGN